jgi:hypothetical protein
MSNEYSEEDIPDVREQNMLMVRNCLQVNGITDKETIETLNKTQWDDFRDMSNTSLKVLDVDKSIFNNQQAQITDITATIYDCMKKVSLFGSVMVFLHQIFY